MSDAKTQRHGDLKWYGPNGLTEPEVEDVLGWLMEHQAWPFRRDAMCSEHERPAVECFRLAMEDYGQMNFTNCEWEPF